MVLMESLLFSIEKKWQKKWGEKALFESDPDKREKLFATFPYPYLNGPLHLGHAFTSSRVDVYARYHRMNGKNVLFPFAWHVTGEPIAGVAERLKKGDVKQKKILLDSGVPEKDVDKFTDPKHIIAYYRVKAKEAANKLGLSVDWRREFTTTPLTPPFSRFIEWQYNTLKKKGYVKQGTHPVIWCTHCQSPTGDHDRLTGEGVSVVEYILLKFRYGDSFLVAATLRPETIYGVVNLWINPDAVYVRADVDGEKWIISREAVQKISEQNRKVELLDSFKGEVLIGKPCRNPVLDNEVPIFPAGFVDPANATGVVMSVPSHAPFDYIALKDLEKNDALIAKFGIAKETVMGIKPIALIKTEGFGEHPAIEIAQKMGLTGQDDPRCEQATKEVYKKEFHTGVLTATAREYNGLTVSNAKKIITKEFIEKKVASSMYETAEKVVCRCNTPCIVKILENQWFLAYGDPAWKDKAKECLKAAAIYPPEARSAFEYTIDWLEDKPCARKGGLGTPLPWDPAWKVETLSDSTVYMAYYTIAKYINELKISETSLTDSVFDFIFLNQGSIDAVAKESGLKKPLLKKMKEEFEYWYPVDFRNSAKELIFNHLTFFVFQHAAIFPKKHWPKSIGVNGMINVEGEKMSKSKGNFVTILDALTVLSADTVRLGLIYTAEGMSDPDWKWNYVKSLTSTLERFVELAKAKPSGKEDKVLDAWLMSRMQQHVKDAVMHYDTMNTRAAIQCGFFDSMKDIKWYMKRGGSKKLKDALLITAKLSCPVIPHTAEEVYSLLGGSGFCSESSFPAPDKKAEDAGAERMEELVKNTFHDIEEIIRFKKLVPKKIYTYIAEPWKYEIYKKVRESPVKNAQAIAMELLNDERYKRYGKAVITAVNRYVSADEAILGAKDELAAFSGAAGFFREQFKCGFEVYSAENPVHDPIKKASHANPGKPAIYIES